MSRAELLMDACDCDAANPCAECASTLVQNEPETVDAWGASR